MQQHRRLPRFIIIGAAKAATTWIGNQLRDRPDVFLPRAEPHYFSREYSRGPGWYADLFGDAGADQLIGEKSADYLADANVPPRMAALLPDVKLIALLRNPVERAYSDYCMWFRRGDASSDIDIYFDRARTPLPRFLDDGLYARHLVRFLDYFPAEQLKVMLYEEIKSRPVEVVREICTLLEIDPDLPITSPTKRINDSAAALVPMPFRRLPEPVKKAVKPLRGSPLFESVRKLIARPVEYPPLHGDLRRRLEDFYARDVEQLGRLLGQDLSGWMKSPEPVR